MNSLCLRLSLPHSFSLPSLHTPAFLNKFWPGLSPVYSACSLTQMHICISITTGPPIRRCAVVWWHDCQCTTCKSKAAGWLRQWHKRVTEEQLFWLGRSKTLTCWRLVTKILKKSPDVWSTSLCSFYFYSSLLQYWRIAANTASLIHWETHNFWLILQNKDPLLFH